MAESLGAHLGLQHIVLGNSLLSWILAIFSSLGLTFVLRWGRGALLQHLLRLQGEKESHIRTLAHTLLTQTKIWFLTVAGVWFSTASLTFSVSTELLLKRLMILSTGIQIAIWGGSLIQSIVESQLTKGKSEAESNRALDPATQTALELISSLGKIVFFTLIFLFILHNFGVDITDHIS